MGTTLAASPGVAPNARLRLIAGGWQMQNETIVLAALGVGAALVLALLFISMRKRNRQRSAALKENFGPEYDRAVAQHGDRARAERDLRARQRRLDDLDIKLLSAEQCARFAEAWALVQQRFVDEPSGAVMQADGLVKEVMLMRGYPMGNFEQRVADLSVEHANVVDHYRAARTLALANASGTASTEDLRQAMVHYRALFNDLLQARASYAPLREART
jgi:hypothetical protein